MRNTKTTGDAGEREAVRLLRRKHYRIRGRNVHTGRYELDIIAENREFVVFVEVKTRTADKPDELAFGMRAADAVDTDKRRCTVNAARMYLVKKPSDKQPRFDVIEVYYSSDDKPRLTGINHIENSF